MSDASRLRDTAFKLVDGEICPSCMTEIHPRFRCDCYRGLRFLDDGMAIVDFFNRVQGDPELSERDKRMMATSCQAALSRNRLRNGQVITTLGQEQVADENSIFDRLPKYSKPRVTFGTRKTSEPIG